MRLSMYLLCLLAPLTTALAFSAKPTAVATGVATGVGNAHAINGIPRGGGGGVRTALDAMPNLIPLVQSSLRSGPCGVLTLATAAATVCVPICQVKTLYGISVGYGLSVTTMALSLGFSMASATGVISQALNTAAILYGLRLASFLFVRDVSGWKPLVKKTEVARLKRIPFALSLSIFYAFMATPLLYAMRHPVLATTGWQVHCAKIGAGAAFCGLFLEAVADGHKFLSKLRNQGNPDFVGPTNGAYRLTRHPNYTGEVLFWLGIYAGGLPSFGKSVIAWVCSTVGIYGIVSIMQRASKSLETRHAEKYGGQTKYEEWKDKVSAPLIPFVRG